MKTVFAIAALAVLAAAGPAHHRRGAKACKAVYPTKVDGGEETKTGGDWSKSTDKEDKKKGDDSKTDNDTDTSATMTCPNDGGKTLKAGGSCDCDYQVNCDSKANVPSTAKFWERTSGEIILSLAECVSICDENSECEACIWYVLKLFPISSQLSASANRRASQG